MTDRRTLAEAQRDVRATYLHGSVGQAVSAAVRHRREARADGWREAPLV